MKMNHFISFGYILIGFGLGTFFSFFYLHNSCAHCSRKRFSTGKSEFFLGVAITFDSEHYKEEFKKSFKPLAEYVMENEFSTLSYKLSESDKDSLKVFIAERYDSKESYLEIHRKSKQFLLFKKQLTNMSNHLEIVGHSYIESNLGFV